MWSLLPKVDSQSRENCFNATPFRRHVAHPVFKLYACARVKLIPVREPEHKACVRAGSSCVMAVDFR